MHTKATVEGTPMPFKESLKNNNNGAKNAPNTHKFDNLACNGQKSNEIDPKYNKRFKNEPRGVLSGEMGDLIYSSKGYHLPLFFS